MTPRTGVLLVMWIMIVASITNSIAVWVTRDVWNLVAATACFVAAVFAYVSAMRMKARE